MRSIGFGGFLAPTFALIPIPILEIGFGGFSIGFGEGDFRTVLDIGFGEGKWPGSERFWRMSLSKTDPG